MTYYCCFILFLRVCICSHLYNYCLKARQQVWDMSLSCFLVIVLINDAQHSLPVINPSLSLPALLPSVPAKLDQVTQTYQENDRKSRVLSFKIKDQKTLHFQIQRQCQH